MTDYYSLILDVSDEDELDRVCRLARSMPSYHRIYIDDKPGAFWADDAMYDVEILFADEQDATMFNLKL